MSETTRCPSCGCRLKLIPLSQSPPGSTAGNWQEMIPFHSGISSGISEFLRETPRGQMSLMANVVAPIAAALVTGGLVGVCSIFVMFYFSWPWWIPLIVWIGTVTISWFAYFAFSQRLLFIREHIFSEEAEPTPPPEARELRIEIAKTNDVGRVKGFEFLDLQVEPEALITFAQDVAAGGSLSVHRWVSSGLFSRGEFDGMMDRLQRQGFLRDLRGNKGRQLTAKGLRVFEELARH